MNFNQFCHPMTLLQLMNLSNFMHIPLEHLKRGRQGRPPTGGPNSFNFMQFWEKICQIIAFNIHIWSWCPHLAKILDLPLHMILSTYWVIGWVTNITNTCLISLVLSFHINVYFCFLLFHYWYFILTYTSSIYSTHIPDKFIEFNEFIRILKLHCRYYIIPSRIIK